MSLNDPIKSLEKSSNGLSVRTSLITLLSDLLSDSDFVAGTLLGYNAGEFTTKELLQSNYQSIADSFEYILNETVSDSIYQALSKTSSLKDQIRLAIDELYGSSVVPTDPENDMSYFEKYPDIIRDISEYLNVRTTEVVTIEDNGEVESEDEKAFSSVVVDIPEKTLTTRAITENGTYYAQQDGADGYEYVTVAVTGSIQKFTVRFWSEDRQQILYTAMNIPYGGYAQFDAAYPESGTSGMYFTGWNPNPVNVTANMDCYPVFSSVPTGENEITDSWETIVANHGAGYPLGSYKYIEFDPSFVFMGPPIGSGGDYPYYGIAGIKPLQMIKVATGEGGSTSTWLFLGNICAEYYAYYNVLDDPSSIVEATKGYLNGQSAYTQFSYLCDAWDYGERGWPDCSARTFFNGDFFNKFLPPVIRNAIVSVPKSSSVYDGDDGICGNYQTRDKVWLPSIRELLGDTSRTLAIDIDGGLYDTYNLYKRKCLDNNTSGMDYSSVIFSDEPIAYSSGSLYPFKDYINFRDYSTSHSLPRYSGFIACRDAIEYGSDGAPLTNLNYTLDSNNSHIIPHAANSAACIVACGFGFCL